MFYRKKHIFESRKGEKEKVSMLEIDRERLELEKQIVAIADNY